MPYTKFWAWCEAERVERGLSYDEMAERGGKGHTAGSGIYRAIKDRYMPSLDTIDLIARAFDMTRLDVLRKAGYIRVSPQDLEEINPTLMELYEIASHLGVVEQKILIRQMRGLTSDETERREPHAT